MGRLTTSRCLLIGLLVSAVALAACSDDPDDADRQANGDRSSETTGDPGGHAPATTDPPAAGDIDVPTVEGTVKAALPSIGFGIAFPEGWQATVLTEEAFRRLEGGDLDDPSFVAAARRVADAGAVFYAAGADDQGRVGELKVDVQDDAATDASSLLDLAERVAAAPDVVDPSVGEVTDDLRVRVDYRIPEAGEGADGEPIDTYGSQLFVADGDRLWSLIVTSEDRASQDALLSVFQATFTLS